MLTKTLFFLSIILGLGASNSHAKFISVESLSSYIFQYEPEAKGIITNEAEFQKNFPVNLYIKATKNNQYHIKIKVQKGNCLFINHKLYKTFEDNRIQLIPISNLEKFARKPNFLISITGPMVKDFKQSISLVYSVKTSDLLNNSYKEDSNALPKSNSIFIKSNFSQFAFITLMLITVFFNQSLFAKRTVFVGASAIRQSRFRSMDDNLKLFGFNVLLFSFLFTGFSLQNETSDVFLFGIILRNIVLICMFFGFKIFLNGATKKIFFDSNALSFYANNYLHITALFGIFLASFFYLETFSYFDLPKIPIGAYLLLFIFAESAYVVSFAFMNYELSKYKLFYIISYICAFEGIPLLILAKYLFQLGIISP